MKRTLRILGLATIVFVCRVWAALAVLIVVRAANRLGVTDTMALISSKLSNLVPFSCAALFLYEEDSDVLRCRCATGDDRDVGRIACLPHRGCHAP